MPQLPPTSSSASPQRASVASEATTGAVIPIAPPADIETQPIIRHFSKAVENAPTYDALLKSIFHIVDAETDCLALWRIQTDGENSPKVFSVSDDNADALWESFEPVNLPIIEKVREFDQICSSQLIDQKHVVVAAPLSGVSESTTGDVLAGCFALKDQSVLRLQWLMGIASVSVNQWLLKRQAQSAQSESRSLNEALTLVNNISGSNSLNDAAITIVNRLRRLFKADQTALAQVDFQSRVKLLAVSDLEKPDQNAVSNRILHSAISQALVAEKSVSFPNLDPAVSAAQVLPLENWCKAANAARVINLPLKLDDGTVVGTLLVTFGQTGEGAPAMPQQAYMESMAQVVTKPFDAVGRFSQSPVQKLKTKISNGISRKLIIGVFLLAGLMAVPWPYRVKCECLIQPVQRSFVAAPYDGILEKSLVEVGEVVTSGQVIARLDGRQLRIELAGLEAEFEGARRRRDSSLAIREIAQSQIARSDMNRLSAQIELLNNRIKDLEVRSPIAGVIVSGDMEKAQGAPLEMGQNLFEVAPLETMVAEIGIPESEIHYVKSDNKVSLKINSFPFQTWDGDVQQIHPSAEIVGDQTVFIAEVELDNASGVLRPGMEGNAKISTQWSPIGWNLFHNAWESIRYWTIW